MTNTYRIAGTFFVLSLVANISCTTTHNNSYLGNGEKSQTPQAQNTGKEKARAPVKVEPITKIPGKYRLPDEATQKKFAELARYISGMPREEDQRYRKVTRSAAYKRFARRLDKRWQPYERSHLQKLSAFAKQELKPEQKRKVIFYPFSGPDMNHPVRFFPEADSYHLFGLEPAGKTPKPRLDQVSHELRYLNSMRKSIRNSFRFIFFRTKSMKVQIGANRYSSIPAIMMFFLTRNGYTVVQGRRVSLDPQGEIVPWAEVSQPSSSSGRGAKLARGYEILFRKGDGELKRTVYFSINLEDGEVFKYQGAQAYLRRFRKMTTMLKSASYLMFSSKFDDMRNIILGQSRTVVTDASGVPFHYFNKNLWDINLYGVYQKTISLFRPHFQPDLKKAMTEAQPLPFRYGYHIDKKNSELIIVRRKAKHKFYHKEFDKSGYVGEYTRWLQGSKRSVIQRRYPKKYQP